MTVANCGNHTIGIAIAVYNSHILTVYALWD